MNGSPLQSRWLGTGVPYQDALRQQDDLVSACQACYDRDGTLRTSPEKKPADTMLLLEHAPVYTIGRTRDRSSLGVTAHLPHPAVEINRGGQATYHGPGQLVGYPILDLRPYGKDLHTYLRLLEEALIASLSDYQIASRRREGLTGVWVEDRKIASIGVGVRKWIAMHGFALNVTSECLPPFLAITPCGLDGVRMTCLHAESQARPTTREVGQSLHRHLERLLNVAALSKRQAPASE